MEKYTVVIPTRNSIDTLKYTLQTCLSQTYENFEILISDNFSDDGTAEYVKNLNDNRIRYIRTERPLSMTQNFEFALSNAKEGFIMCIGADDGLMPGAINYVDSIVKKYKVTVVACQYAHYFWPNAPVPQHGRLVLNALNFHKSNVEIRQSSEWVKKTLDFQTALYVCDLPGLYYGFVHRNVIDMAVKDGVYFRSITPDAYSAFATSINTEIYAYSFRPFSIAGISGRSNGLSQTIGGDIAKTFVTENAHPIHKNFSFCPAMEVIMGEAFYQFATAFPEKCQAYKIDFPRMLKNAISNTNENNYPEVITAVKKMAEMHNLDFESLKNKQGRMAIKFINRSFQMLSSVLFYGSKYLGMKDSALFAVGNIYDASVALGILESANRKNRIETVSSRFLNRVKKRLFFLSSKDTM
jgi:glycosyltransferase involved in cell wall biosynthesis